MSSKNDRLPDFLIIGAGKSGTTAVFYFLAQHPDIFIPRHKEPNFFALEGVSLDSYELEESKAYHRRSIDTYEDYIKLFEEAGAHQIVGENSNMYLMSEQAIEKILKYVPDAKLIAILRHPADRLISRYNHLVRDNSVPEGGIEKVFDQNSIWWKRPDLVPEGFYGRHLEKYVNAFPSEQLMVVLYDDFKADGDGEIKKMFDFLGVSSDFEPNTEMVLNKSGKLKDNMFNKLLGQDGALIRGSKKVFPDFHTKLKSNGWVKKLLMDWRNKNIEKVELPADIRQRITDEIYKEDIMLLEKLLNRSLKHWYKPQSTAPSNVE